MALKIRLQRFGSNKRPFYQVVVTDSRNPRNGRYIENVGYYNPMTEKSEIELKSDRIVHWFGLGARPTDTVNKLLKIKQLDVAALAKEARSKA